MPAKKKGKAKKGGGNGNGNGNAAADVDLTLQGTAVQVNKTVVEEAPEEHREWVCVLLSPVVVCIPYSSNPLPCTQ